ncbi:MAG: hypothetical protein F6J89_21270 [Symploca sp. SIO1C4]|uniref:Uncharacterized protein n=1 Tax=Symploca sp. SIO1C4 TaxID=2607765 RepID=A0A6B3NAF4_9CYAN|nr:hypothetical protein [Symploca sp. SIO1C4]
MVEKTVTVGIPPSELAAIAYGRLFALAQAENTKVTPRFNTQLTVNQLALAQQRYKEQQVAALAALNLIDASSQVRAIEAWEKEQVYRADEGVEAE